MKPRYLIIGAAAGAGLVTLLVATLGQVPFAFRDPPLHAAIEASSAVVALVAAYLIVGRVRDQSRLADVVLAGALALIAFTNVGAAARSIDEGDRQAAFSTWWSLVLTILSAITFACAAWVDPARSVRPGRGLKLALAGVAAALLATAVPIALFASRLPAGVPASAHGQRLLVGHPLVLAGQLVAMLLFGVAAVGFTRRAERTGDELTCWLGAAAAVGAIARLNYFLFPSVYSTWVALGDFLRLGFYLLLLVGAAREIRRYWEGLAHAAVLEERRRIARDLHDGVAQELAFIVAESSGRAAAAAERALDESRRAIAALTRPVDEPIEVALAQAAEEVAARVGTQLRLTVSKAGPMPAARREALIRIVREAIANAGRHGRAGQVEVELDRNGGTACRLRIVDDGTGFDPGLVEPGGGFGLVSMRERAEALGGRFRLVSAPGGGTEIVVVLP